MPPKELKSELAQFLDSLAREGASPDEAIESSLADIVDNFIPRLHEQSEKFLPNPALLIENVNPVQRELVVNWLIQACDIMHFSEHVLYSTVLTLDRYCAASPGPIPLDMMQKVLMATICTVLKMCVADEIGMPLKTVLPHLCRQQVSFTEILHMEHRVLERLRFEVSAPSAYEFLDVLSVRLQEPWKSETGTPARCLADFLLQLSFFDAYLHYSNPHVILAAAALYVALRSLAASPCLFGILLKDMAMACPELTGQQKRLASCANALHALWVEHAQSNGAKAPFLQAKFSRPSYHSVALLGPPGNVTPSECSPSRWGVASSSPLKATSPMTVSSPSRRRQCSPLTRTWREADRRRPASADGRRRCAPPVGPIRAPSDCTVAVQSV